LLLGNVVVVAFVGRQKGKIIEVLNKTKTRRGRRHHHPCSCSFFCVAFSVAALFAYA